MRRQKSMLWGAAAAVIPVVFAAEGCALLLDYSDYQDQQTSAGTGGSGSGGGGGVCTQPGQQEDCGGYTGPMKTEGVGECKAATRTCGDDGIYGACAGEVLPAPERAGNDKDEDCNGEVCAPPVRSARHGDATGQALHALSAESSSGLGGILVAGDFRGTLDFGSGPLTNTSDHEEGFAASVNLEGGAQWVYHGNSTTGGESVRAIAPSTLGPVITGYRAETGGTGTFGFTAMVDSTGGAGTTRLLTATGFAHSTAVGSDSQGNMGNVYVAGRYLGTLTPEPPPPSEPTSVVNSPSGQTDIFLVKYGPNLTTTQWLRAYTTSGDDEPLAMAVDASGSVHLTGRYAGQPSTGDPAMPSAGAMADTFLMKVNTGGAVTWVRGFVDEGDSGVGAGNAVAIDLLGNVYVAGAMSGKTLFSEMPDHQPESKGGSDAFVAMLDLDGKVGWVKRFGGKGHDEATGVAAHGEHVYVTGTFQGTLDLDGDPATTTDTLAAAGGQDLFLLKLDRMGNVVCSGRFALAQGGQGAMARVASTGDGQFVLAGSWGENAALDFGGGPLEPAGSGLGVFLATFSETSAP